MKTKIILLALLLCIGIWGCNDKEEKKKEDIHPKENIYRKGSPCEYKVIEGKSKILSIFTPEKGKGGKYVKFHFTPNKETKYSYPNIKDTSLLVLYGQREISEKFINKNNIVVGKIFRCNREEITKGTCTPVIFRFPEFKEK